MASCMTVNKIIAYLALIAFTAGCTTMKPLPAIDAESLASQVEVGDKVKIVRNDLTDVTFEVEELADEGISRDGVFVRYSDIRQVQVSRTSTGKTVGLVAAIAVTAIAVEDTEMEWRSVSTSVTPGQQSSRLCDEKRRFATPAIVRQCSKRTLRCQRIFEA